MVRPNPCTLPTCSTSSLALGLTHGDDFQDAWGDQFASTVEDIYPKFYFPYVMGVFENNEEKKVGFCCSISMLILAIPCDIAEGCMGGYEDQRRRTNVREVRKVPWRQEVVLRRQGTHFVSLARPTAGTMAF